MYMLFYFFKLFPTGYIGRGTGAGPAGPADAGPMFTQKSRNKRARSWNSISAAAAQAVNACAAVACFQCLYSTWLLRSQAAIARGPVVPPNRIRSDLRRPEIQKNFLGGMPPDRPSLLASHARSFTTYSTVFTVPPLAQCK